MENGEGGGDEKEEKEEERKRRKRKRTRRSRRRRRRRKRRRKGEEEKKEETEVRGSGNYCLPPGPDRVGSLSDTRRRRHALCKCWPAGGLPSSHDSAI